MAKSNFVKDVYGELKHVSWPTRSQVINATIIVVVLSLVVAALLGAFDWLFTEVLQRFILN